MKKVVKFLVWSADGKRLLGTSKTAAGADVIKQKSRELAAKIEMTQILLACQTISAIIW